MKQNFFKNQSGKIIPFLENTSRTQNENTLWQIIKIMNTLTEFSEYSDHFLHILIIMKEKEKSIDTVPTENRSSF